MSKFYVCKNCNSMLELISGSGKDAKACKETLDEVTANTTEASTEKHIPDVKIEGDLVSVQIGSVIHPMIEEHHIEWIYLETKNGGQRKYLKPGEEPKAQFVLKDDVPVAVYEYCNIHGLWKVEL